MKFGKQMSYVAVKAWFDNYINFKSFKKLLAKGKKRVEEGKENGLSEQEIESIRSVFIEEFAHKLYKAINNTTRFYTMKYTELQEKIDDITVDMHEHNEYSERSNAAQKSFIKRILALTMTCYELRTFLEINKTAGRKLVKKIRRQFGETDFVEEYDTMQNELFRNMPVIDVLIKELEDQYVRTIREIGEVEDKRERPEIVLQLHDEIDSTLKWKQSTVLTNFNALNFRTSEISVTKAKIKPIPIGIAFLFIIAFSVKQFSPSFSYTSQKALGLCFYCMTLWITTAVPFWLTALSTPMWTTVLKILPYDSSDPNAYTNLGKMVEKSVMNPVVFYIMGTFTITAALKETELDKKFLHYIMRRTIKKPNLCFLTLLIMTAFISCFLSHYTTTMAFITVLSTFLKDIPYEYAVPLIIAVVAGGNMGAMMTPLSSIQNMYACLEVDINGNKPSDLLSISSYLGTSIPIAVIYIIFMFAAFILYKKINGFKVDLDNVIFEPIKTDFKWQQIYVIIVSLIIIILWVVLPYGGNRVFSDYGVVGFIALILLYGPGILSPAQVAKLPWNIIFLLMGGNALSFAMTESGLVADISQGYAKLFESTGLWVAVFTTCLFVFIIDVFATHMVTSIVVLPIIGVFAADFATHTDHISMFSMLASMAVSASMIFPRSSLPNTVSLSVVDAKEEPFITRKTLLTLSIPLSILSFILVVTVGYGVSHSMGL